MHKKISLLVTLLSAIGVANADLGSIKVQSFLYQPLKATIPITNIANGDYTNLVITLADAMQYRNQGVPYTTDLGLLQFRVVNNGNNHYLLITSSKPISDPTLSVLLHYREGDNDYYRQYNILLNSINYSSVGYANSPSTNYGAGGVRVNPIAVGNINGTVKTKGKAGSIYTPTLSSKYVQEYLNRYDAKNQTFRMESGDSLYIPIRFTQEIYPLANLKTNQVAVALGFANYPYLHDKDYIYESTTVINLANARQITLLPTKDTDQYIWRSDEDVINRQLLLSSLASRLKVEIDKNNPNLFIDETIHSVAVIKKKASSTASSKALITTSGGVTNKASTSKEISSNIVKKAYIPPPVYQEPSILDLLMENLYEIGGVILGVFVLVLVVIRKKRNNKKFIPSSPIEEALKPNLDSVPNRSDNIFAEDVAKLNKPIKLDVPDAKVVNQDTVLVDNKQHLPANSLNKPQLNTKSLDSNHVDNLAPVANLEKKQAVSNNSAANLTKPLSDSSSQAINLSEEYENIASLESFVASDPSRKDLKVGLLELYIAVGDMSKAQLMAQELDNELDFNNNLRVLLDELTTKYGITLTNNHVEPVTENKEDLSIKSFEFSNETQTNLNGNADVNILDFDVSSFDFSSGESTSSLPKVTKKVLEESNSFNPFAQIEAVEVNSKPEYLANDDVISFDFTEELATPEITTPSKLSTPSLSSNSGDIDAMIEKAGKLCQNGDLVEAKQLLLDVLQRENISDEQRNNAIDLIDFFNLND